MGNPTIFVIGGPTASGKTEIAIELAKKHKTEVVSFDSRQLYRELLIGVARPTAEELSAVSHYGIASHSIHQSLSAGDYSKEYRPVVQSLLTNHGTAVLVGGTGLYLQHLLFDLDEIPNLDPELRDTINQWHESNGLSDLINRLLQLDKDAGNKIDLHNPARVKRALELCMSAGKPLGQILQGQKEYYFKGADIRYIGIQWVREELYQRVNLRVDAMMDLGLLHEVESLVPFAHLPVLKTVGYTELFDYLTGTTSFTDAVDKIKQHTRNYAKRQITYFNRQFSTEWLKKDVIIDRY